MSSQSDVANEISTAIQFPYWVDISAGIFELGAYLGIMIIAHILARRKEIGGVNMLICVYLSLFFGALPLLIPGDSLSAYGAMSLLLFGSNVASSFLMFLAIIHLLRYTYAKTS